MSNGKARRLRRILPRSLNIWLPIDDSLISGPFGALAQPATTIDSTLIESLDAILGFRGILDAAGPNLLDTALVENLSASVIGSHHTRKVRIGSVEGALSRGVDAVAYHLNITAPTEPEMLVDFGIVSEECDRLGVPLVAITYPRGVEHDGSDNNYEDVRQSEPDVYASLVARTARIAVELGADVVKTHFTGSAESFADVVDASFGKPILVAGGGATSAGAPSAKELAVQSVRAGASGVCFGRRFFLHPDPADAARVVRNALDDEEARK